MSQCEVDRAETEEGVRRLVAETSGLLREWRDVLGEPTTLAEGHLLARLQEAAMWTVAVQEEER